MVEKEKKIKAEEKIIENTKIDHKDYILKNNIEFYRNAAGKLSQQYVADRIGISRQHLNLIENKGNEPKAKIMLLIYMFFKNLLPEIKLEDLFWVEKKDED